jgi:molybdenum cofactor cytidylyltransferase
LARHRITIGRVLSAVILAAGDSSRMGTPKAALVTPDGGDSFIARIVRTLRAADVRDLVIVTGRHHDAVIDALTRDRVITPLHIVRNPDPSRGQLSSLLTGMDAVVTPRTEGLMMTLVDVPLVRVATVIAVIEEWRRSRAPIVRPAIGDRHGHPVIFDRAVLDEIHRTPLDAGAKSVVRAHEHEIVNVPVDDEGCVRDVDTPSDYDEMKSV